jgi:hypothetical protein
MLSQLSRQLAVVLVDERLRNSNDRRLARSARRQTVDREGPARPRTRTRSVLDPNAISTEI